MFVFGNRSKIVPFFFLFFFGLFVRVCTILSSGFFFFVEVSWVVIWKLICSTMVPFYFM